MSEENNNFTDSDPCPDEQELNSYASGEMASSRFGRIIGSHLEFCPSCRSRVEKIRKTEVAVDEAIKVFAEKLKRQQEKLVVERWRGPQLGAIWRTVPESDEELLGPMVIVIQVNKSGSISVAEISEEIGQAIHTDMVLEPKESGLRFRCMVRTGNIFKTSPGRLTLFAGTLSQALMEKVSGFCKEAERFDENIPLSKFVFLKDSQGTEFMRRGGITSGMLVTDESDPRLEFLELSRERCSYLSGKSDTTGKSKVIPLPLRQGFVGKVLALAAVIAVVVVGIKVLFMSEDKPVPVILQSGVASVPRSEIREIRDPIESSVGTAVRVYLGGFVNAGPQAKLLLINRAMEQFHVKPKWVVSSNKPAYSELLYILVPMEHLRIGGSQVDWTCDSVLLPDNSENRGLTYRLALQSQISLSLQQSPQDMADAYTKATAQWVLRYFQRPERWGGESGNARNMVQDFENDYKALYEQVAEPLQKEGKTHDELAYWERLMEEIVARYPNEAANAKGPDVWGLPGGPARLALFTLVVMDAFPTFTNEDVLSEMHNIATEKLRLALKKSLGNSYEDARELAEAVMARRLLEEKISKPKLNEPVSKWIVLRDWGTAHGE